MKLRLLTGFLCLSIAAQAQVNDTITELFHNSYRVYQLQRWEGGMYRDSKLFAGLDFHPISIANTGIGLISLCIADTMGWESNAKDLALETLKSVTGHDDVFTPDRNQTGFFRHFMDSTGANAWNSEYSTIDTDILVCGALFCKRYFQDDSISKYADELWNSIEFNAAIADPDLGRIYLEMNGDGTGKSGSFTLPYNEYMIVAWLARQASDVPESPGQLLWNNFYASTAKLPKPSYQGIPVLSDNQGAFLSSFTHQFNYYLCHPFAMSEEYMNFYRNAYQADSAWWENNGGRFAYEWGTGAGSFNMGSGYNADKINNNPSKIVSPHIIAGFLPVNPAGKRHLLDLWRTAKGRYQLPLNSLRYILWRFSLIQTNWVPNEVQGIDYSTMLFGLASLPEYLGTEFFSMYNDFFDQSTSIYPELKEQVKVFPNPVQDLLFLEFEHATPAQISVYDLLGNLMMTRNSGSGKILEINLSGLTAGIYFVQVEKQGKFLNKKIFLAP